MSYLNSDTYRLCSATKVRLRESWLLIDASRQKVEGSRRSLTETAGRLFVNSHEHGTPAPSGPLYQRLIAASVA